MHVLEHTPVKPFGASICNPPTPITFGGSCRTPWVRNTVFNNKIIKIGYKNTIHSSVVVEHGEYAPL